MAVINVYKQYFEAEGVFNTVERKGAAVYLISDSEAGQISYKAAVSFFPHSDEEDFGISYDAYYEAVLFEGKGRRSKKKEEKFLEELQEHIDTIAQENGAKVHWDKPLIEAERG